MDQETVNTFNQLRQKVVQARRARQRVVHMLQNEEALRELEKSVLHKKLILAEMSRLPADAVTYKNVGKAYLFTPKSAITAQYEDAFKSDEDQITKGRGDRETYVKQIDSSEVELKEYLQANPVLASQVAAEVGR